MKQCPICRTTYTDEMNYCLSDGSNLNYLNSDSGNSSNEQTLSFEGPAVFTQPNRHQPTEMLTSPPKKKSQVGKFLLGGLVCVLIFFSALVYGLVSMISKINSNISRQTQPLQTNTPAINVPELEKVKPEGKLKVEVLDKVKDNFGDSYLKCLITNVGETVIVNPSISLDLYNNDVKTGTLSEKAKLEYLKPQQTVPVWISLSGEKKFTTARYDNDDSIEVSDKEFSELFPNLIYTNAKLSVEFGTSSYNFRSYQDKIFSVSGVVENQIYDTISPELFILYYDNQDEIVGISSTYPSTMKKGEKSSFEASISKTNSFGTPVRFEVIAVNDK